MPANSVAKVGDSTITKTDFNHWLKNASSGQQQGGAGVVPDPPDYSKCVAGLKKQGGAAAGKQSTATLKKQCKTQYDQLKGEVMQFLVQAQWVQQEAKSRDVKVTDAEVKQAFASEKKKAFPKEADYKKFLKTSGMNEDDILFRLKLDQLQTKLTKKVTAGKVKVTDADVKGYYAKNKARFAQPEQRDLNVVLTKTKAKADQAKSQLAGGKSFKVVSKKLSIDQASKAQGGKLPALVKGKQDPALDKVAFTAKKGKLKGPVKTQFGYYVFKVAKVTKASQQTEAQAADTIRNLLKSQRQQKALNSFVKDFRKRYKGKTNCAKDFRIAECKNAPKNSTNTAAGGAAQQQQQVPQQGGGAAPQQVPQQGGGAAPQQVPQQGGGAVPQQGGGAAPQQVPPQQGSGATPQTPSSPTP